MVAHFPEMLAEEWGVGCVAALLLDADFLLTCYLCSGLVRAWGRNCTLISITARDSVLGAMSKGWIPFSVDACCSCNPYSAPSSGTFTHARVHSYCVLSNLNISIKHHEITE